MIGLVVAIALLAVAAAAVYFFASPLAAIDALKSAPASTTVSSGITGSECQNTTGTPTACFFLLIEPYPFNFKANSPKSLF